MTWTRFAEEQPGDREVSGEAVGSTQQGDDGGQHGVMEEDSSEQLLSTLGTSVDPPISIQGQMPAE